MVATIVAVIGASTHTSRSTGTASVVASCAAAASNATTCPSSAEGATNLRKISRRPIAEWAINSSVEATYATAAWRGLAPGDTAGSMDVG